MFNDFSILHSHDRIIGRRAVTRRVGTSAVLCLIVAVSRAAAQACVVAQHVPHASTCLVLEYAQAMARMADAENGVNAAMPDTADVEARAFYAMKSRMIAERLTLSRFRPYRTSRDKEVAEAARYVVSVFSILLSWDSTGEVDYRRILRFEMPLPELQEKRAQQAVTRDKTFELIMAGSGSVLDANVVMPRERGAVVTQRRMTLAERDTIVGEIRSFFKDRLDVDKDHNYTSGWAAVADGIRQSLLNDGWKYSP